MRASPYQRPSLRAGRGMSSSKRGDIQGLRAIAVLRSSCSTVRPGLFPGGFVGRRRLLRDLRLPDHGRAAPGARPGGHARRSTFWGRPAPPAFMPAADGRDNRDAAGRRFVLLRCRHGRTTREARRSRRRCRRRTGCLPSNAGRYLHAATLPSPFQHFWSLSVEEQFYIRVAARDVALLFAARARFGVVPARSCEYGSRSSRSLRSRTRSSYRTLPPRWHTSRPSPVPGNCFSARASPCGRR